MSVTIIASEAKAQANVERGRGNYEAAAKILRGAVARLEDAVRCRDSTERNEAAAELADVLGVLGGVYKRQNDLAGAAKAYDAGFRYECDPQFDIRSSYNALNRLVVRVIGGRPSYGAPAPNDVDVALALRELRSVLEASVSRERDSDYWAAGDLMIVCALLGDDQAAEAADRRFSSLFPPKYAYEGYKQTLATLADALPERRASLDRLQRHFLARMGFDPGAH